MNYHDNLVAGLRDESEKVLTENGAPSYTSASIRDELLRLFYEVSATHKQIIDSYETAGSVAKRWGLFQTDWRKRFVRTYKHASEQEQKLLLRLLGMVRDPRRGMGERAMFRGVLYDLFRDQALNPIHLGEIVAEYGRWDDLIAVFAKVKAGRKFIARILLNQLRADQEAMARGKSVSLLAKWMPKENASSKETKRAAHELIKIFRIKPRNYRRTLSALRKYLKVVERDMSANRWDQINYDAVPSLAMSKYRTAFYNHDAERFQTYLTDVKEGRAKINAGVANPAVLVRQMYEGDDGGEDAGDVAVAQWEALPRINFAKPMIPICDVSGSMCTPAGGGAMCIDVAVALSILLSEANTGPYKDIILTFSNHPTVIDFSKVNGIAEKVKTVYHADWGGTTNVADALRTILAIAVKNGVPKGSVLPDLVVFSDMEFNEANGDFGYDTPIVTGYDTPIVTDTLFESVRREYESAGYPFPKVIFWNLSSNGRALLPLKKNDLGITLMSGYSQYLFDMLCNNRLDPYDALLDQLAKPEWANMERLWRDLSSGT